MGYGNIVANYHFRSLIGTMNNRTILNIGIVPNCDRVHIAPDYGIEPDAAIIAHYHLSYYSGIVGQKTVLPKLWVESPDRFDDRHNTLHFK
jgi:hypothetical protein